MNPSADWLPEERLAVVAAIALKMMIGMDQMPINQYQQRDYAERMRYIAAQSAAFLELNRGLILSGLEA